MKIDLLIKNIKELVNPANDRVVRGNDLNSIKVSHHVWLGAAGEDIAFIGYEEDFNQTCTLAEDAVVIDGSSFVVMPGFVDPHTHLPFAGTRQDEFRLKLQGVSYQEIAASGGGIKGTVRKTREIETDDLISVCEQRLTHMLLSGTTTIEAKSGYGLDRETELKQLEVLKALTALHPVTIVPTFMGAHEIPEAFAGRNKDFLDYLIDHVVPEVKALNLAEFVDIFCENGVFSYEDAEYYLDKIEPYGFKIKMHADEFTSNNAALLAVKRKAVSAEHLIAMTPEEIEAISDSRTACVFLPGVSFFLKLGKYAPIRPVIDKGGIAALGTDFNPGSSMVSSQLFSFHLGIFNMGLTIEEAFNAVTINAAYAIDRQETLGSIALGKKMDVLLMDIPDYSYMAYHLGINPVHTVIKNGEVVVNDHQPVYD
ncbi:MAG: imidazolonepropionase [Candidatus Omnitrophota bacterium]